METFEEYLETIDEISYRDRMKEILDWIIATYPNLDSRIAWNQPMFTHEGTYIMGLVIQRTISHYRQR